MSIDQFVVGGKQNERKANHPGTVRGLPTGCSISKALPITLKIRPQHSTVTARRRLASPTLIDHHLPNLATDSADKMARMASQLSAVLGLLWTRNTTRAAS